MAKKKVVKKIVKRKVLKKKVPKGTSLENEKKPAKKSGAKSKKKTKKTKVPSLRKMDKDDGGVVHIDDMYSSWFIDYASYVILERAVPALYDGLKPVQRRILHSLKEKDDGRYNKVANIVGHTMQYHPHGDASIADALVSMGQKNLLIDTQGNWGNILTGDKAAATRYIEARLSKFALAVAFNAKTTKWASSYDGRNQEPVNLPLKFPLLLAHGAEGIAVGLACKILPHNFIELIDGWIDVVRKKRTKLLPDFPTGGIMDASEYNGGLRGGKVRVRARIEKTKNKKLLKITEIPFGTPAGGLMENIVSANEKGKKYGQPKNGFHIKITNTLFHHMDSVINPSFDLFSLSGFDIVINLCHVYRLQIWNMQGNGFPIFKKFHFFQLQFFNWNFGRAIIK